MGAVRATLLLLLVAATAVADDYKPLPLRRSVIMPSGGKYFVQGRQELRPGQELSKLPSEYMRENIYTTFQDDWVAFQTANLMNHERLLWANDFPHSDSTWPWSQEMLEEHSQDLTEEQKRRILCDNTAELYQIDLAALH